MSGGMAGVGLALPRNGLGLALTGSSSIRPRTLNCLAEQSEVSDDGASVGLPSHFTCAHEAVVVLTGDGDLPLVHEVQDGDHLLEPHAVWHDQHRVGSSSLLLEHRLEVGTAGGDDDLVCLDLLVNVTSDSDIQELVISPQVLEGGGEALVEVLPLERVVVLQTRSHFWFCKY